MVVSCWWFLRSRALRIRQCPGVGCGVTMGLPPSCTGMVVTRQLCEVLVNSVRVRAGGIDVCGGSRRGSGGFFWQCLGGGRAL